MWKKAPPTTIAMFSFIGGALIYQVQSEGTHSVYELSNLNSPVEVALIPKSEKKYSKLDSAVSMKKPEPLVARNERMKNDVPPEIDKNSSSDNQFKSITAPAYTSELPSGNNSTLISNPQNIQTDTNSPTGAPSDVASYPMLLDPQLIDLLFLYENNANMRMPSHATYSSEIPKASRQ